MRVVTLLTVLVALFVGCQRKESPPSDPPKGLDGTRPQLRPGDRIDVHGIVVEMLDGGTIQLTGTDRWGARLDTTYENLEFMRNALPVLERSVTPEQASRLRALIAPSVMLR